MNKNYTKPFVALAITTLIATTAHAQLKIKTLAGINVFGNSGDGGTATSAKISSPYELCVDNAGNIYFPSQNRIRKVDAATHIISTIAGNDTAGFAGDGGLATNAKLTNPSAICLDGSGNIYISDGGNHRIRKIDGTTGIITTVVGSGTAGYGGDGGAATAAYLGSPAGIAVDGSGNIYFSDYLHIRKVSGGTINNFAGTGLPGHTGDGGAAISATFGEYIGGIWLDASGNMYVCDPSNYSVRKITSSGTISTIAGTPGTTATTSGQGDGGLATAAAFKQPQGISVDGSGNVYIADGSDNRIRKIDGSGKISTICGDGNGAYTGNGGLAAAAELKTPTGIWVNSGGDRIYVADQQNHVIREINTFTAVGNVVTQQFRIAPNPSTGIFTLRLQQLQSNTEAGIYNIIGAKVFYATINNLNTTIDASNLPSGVYFMHLLAGGQQTVQKITINK